MQPTLSVTNSLQFKNLGYLVSRSYEESETKSHRI